MSRPNDDCKVVKRFQDDGLGSHAMICSPNGFKTNLYAAKKTSPMCCNTSGLLFGRFRLKGEPDNRTAALS
ncbi:hypothetical protein [Rubripirellula obstinata]|uniref:hypothetical protein n=1 Tax=Rubripirellula obstinata TaxID=406547 RepID=UPI00082F84C8|nr:hypothetical protein [Rubripirellula obstinata]